VIDLGQPALHADGITVFPDHAEPTRFHFLTDRPRLRSTAEGIPELTLLKYRLDPAMHDALGAGLLSLTVDLGVDPDRLERLRRKLAARVGASGVTLSPVAADAGTCQLILIDRATGDEAATDGSLPTPADAQAAAPGSGMVARILGAAAPALYGDNAATFAAVLSAEGTSLVERALRTGGIPAGVIYALEITGIRPALRASVTARWRDVYDFYENRLHGGKLLLATDIGTTMESLVHEEWIKVTVDELVPQDDRTAVYQRAVDEMQRYVIEELFVPTLADAPPPLDDPDGALATIGRAIKDVAGFFSITYSLRDVHRDELKTLSYQLAVARAERLTLSPQGTLSVLLGTEDPAVLDRLVVEVEAGPSPEMRFDIGSLIDLDREGIDHLEVTVAYGDHEASLLLDEATPRGDVRLWYRAEDGLAVRYRYEAHFRAGAGGPADVLAAPERSTEDRVIRVDPRELYERLEVRAVAQGVPFERYPVLLVDLEASVPGTPWSASEVLELGADHPEAPFVVRAAPGAPVTIRRRVRYVDGHGTETLVDWEEVDPGVLVVGDPLPDVLDVQILASARFGTSVRRVVAEVRPHAEPDRVATFVLTADSPAATWSWAAPADGDRGYEYRVTVHTVLDEVRQGPWLPGTGGALIVGEAFARLRQVQVVFVGKSLADLGLLAVKVRLAFTDLEAALVAEDEFLVEDTSAPLRWSYPVADPARQAYTCQLTYIYADGTVEPRPEVTSADLLLVQPLT
jgi:hypothetical protein